ncbi:MAG: mandelate racemase/muconate lactonizing enzyme family protein [Acidobacteria bacterium]|nr:mandelate racemase/muconate lactonizing enzyme family protein [Acidobacteriota bacterium]
MRIAKVEALAISIPLRAAVSDAVRRITHRDHLIVRITTEEGLRGEGFTLGYDGSLAMVSLVDAIYRPILEGADALASEYLWAEMYRQSIQAGRRGAALRTISALDIALWDLRGKAARMPVMHLLGVHGTQLRCYATGGYYREGQTLEELAREYRGYVEQGFTAVKLKVGKFAARDDAERLRAVRGAVGDSVDILLDANGGWADSHTAIAALRRLEEFRPYWIEEPVRADNLAAMARIAEALDWPVATGELESTRWAFAELLARKAADILQPDATVVGGVGEWLKVAHMAAAFDVPIAPHYNWDIHTQLVASIPNGLFIEYFVRGSDVKVFDEVLENPIYPENGYIRPRTGPGFDIRLREDKIEEYRIG